LHHQSSGSQVDRDPKTWPGGELEETIIHQDVGLPLGHFEFEIALRLALTGEPPALIELLRPENFTLWRCNRQVALRDTDPAAPALAASPARKFDPIVEKNFP